MEPSQDMRKWKLGLSKLHAMRSNLPSYIPETVVAEYHSSLELLEAGAGEDLESFRISSSEVKPRVVSFTMGRPGNTVYSKDKFCDSGLFKRKIESLSLYLQSIEQAMQPSEQGGNRDYWALSDPDLEALARTHNIVGYGYASGGIDRDKIIASLTKRDSTLRERQQVSAHTINVGSMNNSVIQQGTSNKATVGAGSSQVQTLADRIMKEIDRLPLKEAAREELRSDIQTIECQLRSPSPKSGIISESFHSVRAILEGVTGSLLASGLVHEISKLFPN